MVDGGDAREGTDPLIGRVLGEKLRILSVLGEGSIGRVYLAEHVALGKRLAVKVLKGQSEKKRTSRFKAEARAASRFEHPHSVQIIDFGEDSVDGLLYIAMELLEGKDLQQIIDANGMLEQVRASRILVQVLRALGAAHLEGVIHRDIKPANVMLVNKRTDEGTASDFVKVLDFGLAKILHADDSSASGPITQQGAVFGTPSYMSPEQARGVPLDARTDLYSCGILLYKTLTGRVPFVAEKPWGVLMQHMNTPPRLISDFVPELDLELVGVVSHALEKDRERRFQSARQMREALEAVIQRLEGAPASAFKKPAPAALPRESSDLRTELDLRPDAVEPASSGGSSKVRSREATQDIPRSIEGLESSASVVRRRSRETYLPAALALLAAPLVAALVLTRTVNHVEQSDVERSPRIEVLEVTGGLPRLRIAADLERSHLEGLAACAKRVANGQPGTLSGSIHVRARIDERGRLGDLRVEGASTECVQNALQNAHVTAPDTGEADLELRIVAGAKEP